MEEEMYLKIFITPSEVGLDLEEFILLKLEEKYMNKEIQSKTITNIKIRNSINIPICRTTSNNIEINVPVKVIYKIYKTGDLIIGHLVLNDIEKE